MPKGFTLITDEQAKKLAEICPPHKVILDCGWEIPVAAFAISCGAQTIERLIAPYHERIQENPELKKKVGAYALRAHEIAKAMSVFAQEFGTIGYEIGVALEQEGYEHE